MTDVDGRDDCLARLKILSRLGCTLERVRAALGMRTPSGRACPGEPAISILLRSRTSLFLYGSQLPPTGWHDDALFSVEYLSTWTDKYFGSS
jgi:hypothetical protein